MSEPEILRRCSSCGASVRSGVVFCPQCGVATGVAQSTGEGSNSEGNEDGLELDAASAAHEAASAGRTEMGAAKTVPLTPAAAPEVDVNVRSTIPLSEAKVTRRLAESPQPLSTQAAVASHVSPQTTQSPGKAQQKPKPGVEKLRRRTAVVLDESAYDSSLRFVIVAAVLFILFLLMLFLSKWIT